jgi:SAM-dependent methyltransferase
MGLGWINVNKYSFNSFLLMERFQIDLMFTGYSKNEDWKHNMGIALNANPAVKWYFEHRCPEQGDIVMEIAVQAQKVTDQAEIRRAEVFVLESVEDFVTFTTPEVMDTNCKYIYGWSKERLFEMADFKDKVVLDVGSGSGRLAFAASKLAKEVYASEPVEMLREFIRNKAKHENINNIQVAEALITSIPYPDNTFDIVMSGHVVDDDWDAEIDELTRVCKPGGWLLDCPGEETLHKSQPEFLKRGFEEMNYVSIYGFNVYRYRKQVLK